MNLAIHFITLSLVSFPLNVFSWLTALHTCFCFHSTVHTNICLWRGRIELVAQVDRVKSHPASEMLRMVDSQFKPGFVFSLADRDWDWDGSLHCFLATHTKHLFSAKIQKSNENYLFPLPAKHQNIYLLLSFFYFNTLNRQTFQWVRRDKQNSAKRAFTMDANSWE